MHTCIHTFVAIIVKLEAIIMQIPRYSSNRKNNQLKIQIKFTHMPNSTNGLGGK